MRHYRHFYYTPDFERTAYELDTLLRMSVNGVKNRLLPHMAMQEPDFTAAIVTEFPNLMNKYFIGGSWNIGASFAHQRPYVTFNNHEGKSVTCELADLLLVCHKNVDGYDRYNAALMQLKMDDNHDFLHCIHDKKELVQLELYETWPDFEFRYRKGVTYSIKPKCVTPGAQYLFVNEIAYPLFTHAMPAAIMNNDLDYTLGRFLVAFTQWQTGRPIAPEADKNNDDWSKVIWDLIDANRKGFYNRRNIQHRQVPRNNGEFLQLITMPETAEIYNAYFEEYIKGDLPRYDNNEEDSNPVIPMLFIEL